MKITCTTNFEAPESGSLFGVYDIDELSFELSEPFEGKEFFCVSLCDEAVYVYRDDVAISGDKFTIGTDNFLDALKGLPDANMKEPTFSLAFQLEIGDQRASDQIEIKNPWA